MIRRSAFADEHRLLLAALLCAWCAGGTASADAVKEKTQNGRTQRPNVLIIVADDLAFSDLGAFGGEIETPNLDALALNGVRLANFHTAAACAPTRAMLLTGVDHHIAGLGTQPTDIRPEQQGKPGYEGYLNQRVVTLAERLRDAGYRTLLAGKWHLGEEIEHDPARRGFERSFTLVGGAHNHFNTQTGDPGFIAVHRENGKPVTQLPKNFYSSDFFTDKLIEYLNEGASGERPFFAYLAFSAPHFPLQAPADEIARYRGKYDAGYEVLRAKRIERGRALGTARSDAPVAEEWSGRGTWGTLSAADRKREARKMEIFAAMVTRLDRNVGRVIETLRSRGELERTLIFFLSDNGPEGLDMTSTWRYGADFRARIAKYYDNSTDKLGSGNSYLQYGPHWAGATSVPGRFFKHHTTEGGIRSVAFVSNPNLANPGSISHAFTSVLDVAPTVLEVRGVQVSGHYQGRAVAPLAGASLTPLLEGKATFIRGPADTIGWELRGRRALVQGDWKIVDMPDIEGWRGWRLFDLRSDPNETQDLAAKEPAKVKALAELWQHYERAVGVVLPERPGL